MLRPGVFLQDRYEILEQIGSGGMSDVYKAKCHKLNRLVAIKVMKAEFSDDMSFVRKFKMEAQAAAGLSHPNIVSVYDVVDEGPNHYIVMELVEGVTLKSYIAKKGRLEIKESIGIAIQVAQGIAAAHEQNIVHRDIKPQNMIISRDGKVKVADFGIAKAVSSQTLNAGAMGSVHYISPEQARGGYSDARSDIYSLGITMFEMVTGRVPFEGDNTVTVALAHLEEPMVHPSLLNPEVPLSLEKIILKCTEKKPERRYNNAMELIADLRKSLVTPDEDFVQLMPFMDKTAQTVTISPEELAQIKEGKKNNPPYYQPQTQQRPSSRPKPQTSGKKSGRKPVEDDDDVNPQIEKLLTAVGVIVALIIVAVVVMVFAKMSGVFHSGSRPTEIATENSGEISETPDDTQVYMPDVLSLPEDMAEAKLKESTLIMKVSGYEYSDTYEKGEVMAQENPEGSIVSKYSTVNVTISNGPEKTNLTTLGLNGMTGESAKQLLESKGFVVTMAQENSETVAVGSVTRVDPEAAKEGEMVTLYVSLGSASTMTVVPNLQGQTEEIAIGMLVDAELVPGEVAQEYSDTVPQGTVISQDPAAESPIQKGTAVSYTVSMGVEDTRRYIASIKEQYDISSLIGPAAGNVEVEIAIRLKQYVDGENKYTYLMEPQKVVGTTMLPIVFEEIEGAKGVRDGEVEVVDVESGAVLKSYPVTFVAY
ncbi:MAG: Stk1 family PASTA domain-containing Ser/Thr kinase [Lachnospiraceae bacterium]